MNAEQMIKSMKEMENGERIKFLEWLYHNHFYSGEITADMSEAVHYYIEDRIDRELTEGELEVMKLAYREGYNTGHRDGIKQALKDSKA